MAGQRSRLLPLILLAVAAWYGYQYFMQPGPAERTGPATTGMERTAPESGQMAPPAERAGPPFSRTEAPVRRLEEPAPQTVPSLERAQQAGNGNGLTVDGIDLGHEVEALLDETIKVLAGITDDPSAREAVEKLERINRALEIVGSLAAKLPPEGRRALEEMIGRSAAELDQTIAAAYRAPGAGEVIGEEVNALVQEFSTLARE